METSLSQKDALVIFVTQQDRAISREGPLTNNVEKRSLYRMI